MGKVNIQSVIEDIVHVTNQIAGLNMILNDRKNIMARYFEKTGNRQRENDDCLVYVQERTNIEYDTEMLKEVLPKEVYKDVVDMSATISDWRQFVKLLNRMNLSKDQMRDIRSLVSVEKKVNQQKLSKYYETGEVSINSLKGCYNASVKKSVAVRMKNTQTELPIKE